MSKFDIETKDIWW